MMHEPLPMVAPHSRKNPWRTVCDGMWVTNELKINSPSRFRAFRAKPMRCILK
jgi:hypothetical protein